MRELKPTPRLNLVKDQIKFLEEEITLDQKVPFFKDKLEPWGLNPLKPTGVDIFQINLGKMCNQTCKHCHVEAGPDRQEIMHRKTLQRCLDILATNDIPIVDLTGGAPEMNPHFKWFVEACSKLGKKILVRCNLTIIVHHEKYAYLPEFFAKHKVEVISSLPFFNASRTDRQRGDGVFDQSIEAMKLLNEQGYGMEGTGLEFNLVYNPAGAFLPASQHTLQPQFKKNLKEKFGVEFNNLFAITNMPMGRFLEFLVSTGNHMEYMEKLVNAFNPGAAVGVMCRNTISIGWDGYVYDCDFNQMLDLKVNLPGKIHINEFDLEALKNREIIVSQHCFGCTAGAGSSCGGEITE